MSAALLFRLGPLLTLALLREPRLLQFLLLLRCLLLPSLPLGVRLFTLQLFREPGLLLLLLFLFRRLPQPLFLGLRFGDARFVFEPLLFFDFRETLLARLLLLRFQLGSALG